MLGGATPEHDCVLDGSIHFVNSGSPTHTLDFETGEYRGSTYEDLRRATMLLTRMPSVDILWGIVAPTDLPLEERIFRELAVQLTYSDLHVQHEIEYAWQAETMLRMLETAGCDRETLRERPRFSVVCCTASPLLAHGPDARRRPRAGRRAACPSSSTPCPSPAATRRSPSPGP